MRACPVKRKQKSVEICAAFLEGTPKDAPGSVFYGVDEDNLDEWNARSDYYYIDNSYFDVVRGSYFRVTRNAMQHSGLGGSDGVRFRKLGASIRPWRKGRHILVCPQSTHFMRLCGYYGDWTADTVRALNEVTDRPIRIRLWSPDKMKLASTLESDLIGAHCLVTHSSAAAVTAVLAGVPVVCTARCAASPMSGSLADIEDLARPGDRERWASVLADNQFTLEEMRNGTAWRMLND